MPRVLGIMPGFKEGVMHKGNRLYLSIVAKMWIAALWLAKTTDAWRLCEPQRGNLERKTDIRANVCFRENISVLAGLEIVENAGTGHKSLTIIVRYAPILVSARDPRNSVKTLFLPNSSP